MTDATHASANITISPTAPTGASNVTVTTGGEVVTLTNGFTVTSGTPVLISVTPNSGLQGATITSVALVGSFTHFVQGTSVATFGTGITVNALTVTDASHASANITISPTAPTGASNVTVTTGGEVVTLTNGFTVTSGTPVLISVTPNSGLQGATITSVALVGSFTHFVQGTSVATFGTGITVNSLTVTDSSHASANITIAPAAPSGPSNVTVTTGGEVVTLTNGFTVTSGTPVLISVTPNSGLQGATIASVALVGSFTHFVQGTSVATFGTGITVNSLTVTDATHASANITISPTAPAGASNVTVTTGGEVVTLTNGFTVGAGTPVLTSVTPNSGAQGATITSVALVGTFTHFVQGTSVATFGTGITVNSLTVTDATHASANITISPTAPTGASNVTVTTGGEVVTLTNGFTVGAGAPVITLNPLSQSVNALTTVTFTAGATSTPSPTVQWQVSTNGGTIFANIPNATTTSLSFTATGDLSGNQYRAVFTNMTLSSNTTAATLTVTKLTPVITWTNPADMLFGGSLGSGQLNATASVPGTFVYTPPFGTVLPLGNGQTLSVTFTPTDAVNYSTANASVLINVIPISSGGSPANLVTTSVLTRDSNTGQIVVTITIANAGGTTAPAVQITAVSIAGTQTTTVVPIALGNVAPGAQVQTVVRIPGTAGVSGARSTLTISGTVTGGTFGGTTRVTLP